MAADDKPAIRRQHARGLSDGPLPLRIIGKVKHHADGADDVHVTLRKVPHDGNHIPKVSGNGLLLEHTSQMSMSTRGDLNSVNVAGSKAEICTR